ncbi:MAG: GlxA family transcriptional regulator [Aestuariivirga sp.]
MAQYDVTFILLPRFSMIALYGALEPLRIANRFAGPVFSWRFISADGAPVSASNDIPVSAAGALRDLGKPTMAVTMASYEPERSISKPLLSTIRGLVKHGGILAGIDTGPFVLASAGVLDGYRATCHWESFPGFSEQFPRIQSVQSLYEIDRDRMTCAGGAAAIDMMLDWIGRLLGPRMAATVADQLIHFRMPDGREQARVPARARHGTDDPRLLTVIAAMEEQSEDHLTVPQLAERAGISERHLERLFATKLGERPAGFYRRLRLEKAERLLTYSAMPVREVSVACGFSSLSDFSRAFRSLYGKPPTALRKR